LSGLGPRTGEVSLGLGGLGFGPSHPGAGLGAKGLDAGLLGTRGAIGRWPWALLHYVLRLDGPGARLGHTLLVQWGLEGASVP